MSDNGFLKAEPSSKFKNSVSAVRFEFGSLGTVFHVLIHNSSCSMIGPTVKVFFFMPYLRTSSTESIRLTISWTNSAWMYVISSVTP